MLLNEVLTIRVHSFIEFDLLSEYFLSTYYVSGIVLGIVYIVVKEKKDSHYPHRTAIALMELKH